MSTLSSAGIAYAKPDWLKDAPLLDSALCGEGLPQHWAQKQTCTIAETGFGSGLNFLATVQKWLSDGGAAELHYIGIESSPWRPADIERALASRPELSPLVSLLLQQYPQPLRGWQRLRFPLWRTTLDLLFDDVDTAVADITHTVDTWYLNGHPVPDSSKTSVRDHHNAVVPKTALVVGAGLAGSAAASALAKRGVDVTVFDALAKPASATSGNPIAALQSRYHRKQDHLGRWSQAATRHAFRELAEFRESSIELQRCGSIHLLRDTDQQLALAKQLQLPTAVGQWLSPAQASELAGIQIPLPALWQAEACVVNPARLTEARLASNSRITTVCGVKTARLQYTANQWHALDSNGALLAKADIAVLATGANTTDWLPWLPLQLARGQLTAVSTSAQTPFTLIGYSGQLMPPRDGKMWLGATAARQPLSTEILQAEHNENIERLATALPELHQQLDCSKPTGRAAIRCKYLDHLPLAGEISADDGSGLYLTAAHGARGVSNSSLCGEVIAGLACGNPPPHSLVKAVAPLRAWKRYIKKSGAPAETSPINGTSIKVIRAK